MPRIFVPGKPFAKQRPRFSRRSGRAYTPKETESFEQKLGQIALYHFPRPLDGPVAVRIAAVFAPAASWSNVKRRNAIGQPHTQRPDLDNCQKAILDGLNRIAWGDDSQVARITCEKRWGEMAGTIIEINPITDKNWQSIGDIAALLVDSKNAD